MKLLQEFINADTNGTKGTYAGVKFSTESANEIEGFIKSNHLPNPVPKDKLHTTVLYSRKHCPDYTPEGFYSVPIKGEPYDLDIWKTQTGTNALVLKYHSDELYRRHKQLMDQHGATYDFDEYRPHVTLSYDVGPDFKISEMKNLVMPMIEIEQEYGEELDLEWSPDKE